MARALYEIYSHRAAGEMAVYLIQRESHSITVLLHYSFEVEMHIQGNRKQNIWVIFTQSK